MDFLDNLRDKLSVVSKDVSEKAKETAAVAKLKTQITVEENKLKGIYAELGKVYYENPEDENIQAHKDSIAAIKELIAAYKQELDDLKGMKKCCGCGAPMAKEVLFCSKCGAKNEIPEPPVKEDDEEEEVKPARTNCPVCEAEVTEEMSFCEVCGTKLED